MTKLHLTLACEDYDRTRPLMDGRVQPEGIDLTYLPLNPGETFWRMLRHGEFEASEMSVSSYLMAREQGRPFIAIPVFPARIFRHSCIYCHTGAGITEPKDLVGKRVGLPEYQITAALWVRGILQDDYGIHPRQIRWVTVGEERLPFTPPAGVTIEQRPAGENLDRMLVAGEVDALIAPQVIPSYLKGAPQVKRLFEDYKAVEMDYYRRTGLFPIMHTIALKETLWQRHPWVAVSLLKAFRQAKELCYREFDAILREPRKISLAWMAPLIEEERRFFGGTDLWPYSLEENRATLEKMIQYSHGQGFIRQKPPLENLFAANSLEV